MKDLRDSMNVSVDRRSFVKSGLTAATVGAGLLYPSASVLAYGGSEERSGRLDKGDSSILRFLAAAEILETDFPVDAKNSDGLRYCGSPTFRTSSANRGSERMGSSEKSVFKPGRATSRS